MAEKPEEKKAVDNGSPPEAPEKPLRKRGPEEHEEIQLSEEDEEILIEAGRRIAAEEKQARGKADDPSAE